MIKLVVDNTAKTEPVAQGFRGREPEEITKAVIDRLAKEPRTGKDCYVQDTEVPGFKVRRDRAGRMTFVFIGRIRGAEGENKNRLKSKTLGLARGKGAMSVATARAKAAALRDKLRDGVDPDAEQRAREGAVEAARREREQAKDHRQWTPAYALAHMLKWRADRKDAAQHLKPESVEQYERGIGYLGKLAQAPIVDIRADDIRKALDEIGGKAKPSKARRALSAVITHTIKRLELNIPNPVSRLDRGEYKPPEPRDSYIREGDIGEFIHKVEAIRIAGREREEQRARDYLLLALAYGTRKEELMRMEWAWIDWKAGVITIPATATKQKRVHHLPLTSWTRAILEQRREREKRKSLYVFPGDAFDETTGKLLDQPVTNIRRTAIRALGSAFKLHDLRRTLTTHCASLGVHGSRLKAIVGHARQGVTENYDQREIEQVRRELTTYHEWLKEQHYWYGFKKAFPNAERDAAESHAEPKEKEKWPGVA